MPCVLAGRALGMPDPGSVWHFRDLSAVRRDDRCLSAHVFIVGAQAGGIFHTPDNLTLHAAALVALTGITPRSNGDFSVGARLDL